MATKGDFIQTTRQNKRVYILKEDIFAITQQQTAVGSSVYCRSLKSFLTLMRARTVSSTS
jgi:hypothetical protein